MGGQPYRTPSPPRRDAPTSPPPREEVVAYALGVAVGVIPVAGAITHGERFGAAATVGLIVLVLGVAGLARAGLALRRARRPGRSPGA